MEALPRFAFSGLVSLALVASTQVHTKLLTQAAREVLRPLGLVQRGRSRSWIDDHGWWLCLVDFDSSSFAKGSYVNVAAMWLWDDEDVSFHYDVGGRVDDVGFVEFDTPEQFAAAARRLAEVAARAVTAYRKLFTGLRPAAEFLEARTDSENPHRDAASAGIAWGMLGEMAKAEQAFEKAHQIIEGYWRALVREVASRSDAERMRAAAAGVHFRHGPTSRASDPG
jgi:hypothetical protein